jgi:hypothetical protein
MNAVISKQILEEMKQVGIASAEKKLSEHDYVTDKQTPVKPLLDLSLKLIKDLDFSLDIDFEEIEDDSWHWFSYLFHKGVATAVAARYGRNDISLVYSFDEAKQGKILSYALTLTQEDGEYSFNIKQHFFRFDWPLQEIYYDLTDFIKDNKNRFKEQDVQLNEILMTFLSFAGIIGIDFVKRIQLTKDDYWSIRPSIEILDENIADDSDLVEIDLLGQFEEPVIKNDSNYEVKCSFCGTPALVIPKEGDVWNEAILEPCEHFAFAFITNTNNHIYGRPYYKMFIKRAVIGYVETYKGYTCQNDPEGFINDFLNGDTDLNSKEMESIIAILKIKLPDCNIQSKQFELKLNNNKHVFLFHFMKFV